MLRLFRLCLYGATLLGAFLVAPLTYSADPDVARWDVTFDNDMWGDGTDSHYTHGTVIRRTAKAPSWLERLARKMPCGACRTPNTWQVELGQDIYTPDDTGELGLVSDDRPYAGWLYLGARVMGATTTQRGVRRSDALGLTVGVVGPAAQADKTQDWIHEMRKLDTARGWDQQLRDEPGLLIDYTRRWQFIQVGSGRFGLGLDASPYLTGALGNVQTYLGAGVTVRAGAKLGQIGGADGHRSGWHVFANLESRAVAHNIFLDGNSWEPSHRVAKRPVVGEAQVGLSYGVGRFEMRLAQTLRSREFYGQGEADRFGSLTFSFRP